MEVHHHTRTPRKKWTHYFWEFLMLFLAVFAGFLAENQREHYVENYREKQFMITMVEDLKSDTAQLVRLIGLRKQRIRELDTLFELVANNSYLKEGRKVYSLYEDPYWDILRFFPSDRTMQQLKNSGNLRLIRKRNVSDALIRYDVWIRNRKEYEPIQFELAGQMNQYIDKLLDPIIINQSVQEYRNKQLVADTVISLDGSRVLPDNIVIAKLERPDKRAILKYINQVIAHYFQMMRDNMSERLLAEETLRLITKEYNL